MPEVARAFVEHLRHVKVTGAAVGQHLSRVATGSAWDGASGVTIVARRTPRGLPMRPASFSPGGSVSPHCDERAIRRAPAAGAADGSSRPSSRACVALMRADPRDIVRW